jgi:hypothetical protein
MFAMRTLAATVGLGVLFAGGSAGNAATTYTFGQFDVPGATRTTPFDIAHAEDA